MLRETDNQEWEGASHQMGLGLEDRKTLRLSEINPVELLPRFGPIRTKMELERRIETMKEPIALPQVDRSPPWPDEEEIMMLIGQLTLLELGFDE